MQEVFQYISLTLGKSNMTSLNYLVKYSCVTFLLIWFTIFTFISAPKHLFLVAWDRNNLKRESFLESYLFYRNLLEPLNKEILYLLSIPWITHFTLLEIIHIALQCYYCDRGHFRQSWLIRLQENNNTFQEGWLWANQQLIIKNNKLLKAQNLILIAKCFTRQCFPI